MYAAHSFLSGDTFGDVKVFTRPRKPTSLTGVEQGAKIEISNDNFGFKYIEAEELEDAIFGLGIVHCRDKLW